jgi:uncharacterized repeat protein (TIGR01451 family)
MKHLLLLFASSFYFIQLSFAQVSGFAITNLLLPPNFNPTSCDQTVNIGFSALSPAPNAAYNFDLPYVIQGNNFSGFQFQSVVNWGDGATSNAGGGISTTATNIVMNPPLTHTYNTPGSYVITTTVYNPANQTYAIDSLNYTVGSCTYQVYAFVGLDCDNNGTVEQNIQNVPFQMIGTNGQLYQDSSQNTMLLFSNIQPGTYTFQIDPQWLATNGFQVQSSFPGNTVTIPNSGITTYSFTLICNQGQTQLCVGGTVFCDQNGNGLLDSNESPVANAPIQVNGFTTYTNTNGQYNLNYVGNTNQAYGIQVSPNWIVNSSYTVPLNAPDSVTANPCTWGTTPVQVNIPLNCSNPSPTNCYGGYVFCDANNNGVFNTGELPLTFAPVQLFVSPNSTTSVTIYTDANGYFEYCGPFVGTSNVVLAQVSPTWLIYNGYTALTSYVTLMGTASGQIINGSIPVNCGGTTTTCTDLWTTVTPWIGYFQNSTAYIKLNWGSYGPGVAGAYTLTMTYPAGVSPILSSIQNSNYTISGNTISWNLNSASTNFTNYDVILFSVPGGLINGAQHFYTSTITPTGSITDCGTYNNNGSLLQILGNSYDPNDKNASTDYMNENYPLGYLDAFVDDALTYTIRFQNTGTAPAQNVYIIDTLSTLLDWTSFTLIEASHPMQVVNLGNGIMRFEFNQIWLPDSTTNEPQSHGHLTYRISEIPTNAIMSVIENTAYIYFDWNAPIITNTTFHQNMWLDNITELEGALRIYPNPAQTEIQLDLMVQSVVQIEDLNGKIVYNQVILPGEKINIEYLKPGIYFVETNQQRTKLIKN